MTEWFGFHGGIQLDTPKDLAAGSGLLLCPLSPRLIFPLLQRDGRNAKPRVTVGQRVLKGQPIAGGESPGQPFIHASSSGVIAAIDDRLLPHPSGLSGPCIVLDADGHDEVVEFAGVTDYRDEAPEVLAERLHAAGIVGLGGAGFPTAVKVRPDGVRVDTLILNGAECEPYISCDDALLRHRAAEVLEGARILLHILQAERCLVGIEEDMPQASDALTAALGGWNGDGIEIAPVPAIYPTGGEKLLIRVLTGREVPADGIPAEVGVVCQNVATAAAVYRAVVLGEPLLSRIVTVTGTGVRRPGNWLTPVGTPIAHLVEQCGGYTDRAERLILGGPMMGFALLSDEVPITKSANCVLVLTVAETAGRRPAMACIRCGACAEACPVELLPQQLYWYSRSDNPDRLAEYHLSDCIECGCCDFVCPSHIPLVQHFRAAKGRLAARRRERGQADQARRRFEARQARRQREQQEKAEAARRKKELLQRMSAGQVASPAQTGDLAEGRTASPQSRES
ncbi:MAG: electron transport complex subunit RsxC [Methylococcaceae bacterium]|nr:electron transport complex subunit RsxC [Methylococcaceae bacterium]